MKVSNKKIFEQCIEQWGLDSQIGMAIEECAELIQVINKWYRGKATGEQFVEELVDVSLMIEQMKLVIGKPDNRFGVKPGYFNYVREYKLDRVKKLLGYES
jgi:hypothetical protein